VRRLGYRLGSWEPILLDPACGLRDLLWENLRDVCVEVVAEVAEPGKGRAPEIEIFGKIVLWKPSGGLSTKTLQAQLKHGLLLRTEVAGRREQTRLNPAPCPTFCHHGSQCKPGAGGEIWNEV
jgi:hypothetical protein